MYLDSLTVSRIQRRAFRIAFNLFNGRLYVSTCKIKAFCAVRALSIQVSYSTLDEAVLGLAASVFTGTETQSVGLSA